VVHTKKNPRTNRRHRSRLLPHNRLKGTTLRHRHLHTGNPPLCLTILAQKVRRYRSRLLPHNRLKGTTLRHRHLHTGNPQFPKVVLIVTYVNNNIFGNTSLVFPRKICLHPHLITPNDPHLASTSKLLQDHLITPNDPHLASTSKWRPHPTSTFTSLVYTSCQACQEFNYESLMFVRSKTKM
jgi:hypothetical protein